MGREIGQTAASRWEYDKISTNAGKNDIWLDTTSHAEAIRTGLPEYHFICCSCYHLRIHPRNGSNLALHLRTRSCKPRFFTTERLCWLV